jgi:hypothetical protein
MLKTGRLTKDPDAWLCEASREFLRSFIQCGARSGVVRSERGLRPRNLARKEIR